MHKILVVNNPKDWKFRTENVDVVAAKAYLMDPHYSELQNVRVFNLCKQYRYQSTGYYVSLLAEAREHKVIPSVTTIQDFKSQAIIRLITDEIDEQIQSSLRSIKSNEFTLSVYFGSNIAKKYSELSRLLYNLVQMPLLRAEFKKQKKWELQHLAPIPVREIPDSHKDFMVQVANEYFAKKRYDKARSAKTLYDLAILVDPDEKIPPSDKKALEKFEKAADGMGFAVDFIGKDDYSRIAEYDALFIRETTRVNHHTYRFSRRAAAEGLVVIDDPVSILRCTNKVFLAEMIQQNRLPAPKTFIIHKDNREAAVRELGLPCVLKQPDSSFSHGVVKVEDQESLTQELDTLLDDSDLIIGQEYIPTEFDWRIGVLDRQPLFACRYYMARGHWQIYNWGEEEEAQQSGQWETFPVDQAPAEVVKVAVKAANAIGDGFYGVDLKEREGKVYIIEINDNPSVEYGVEDAVLKDELYLAVMRSFLNRLEAKKAANGVKR